MMNALRVAVFAAALFGLEAPCFAVDAAAVPEAKRTRLGLYLTSAEVPPFLAERRGRSLFVDVRTPAELTATGVATMVDANAPLLSLSTVDGKPQLNPDFVAEVERRLAAKGLTKDDAVVLICRTGRRSALAANLLASVGFSHVYTVVDGFEGDGGGAGPGMSGWKNSGLPWREAGPSAPPN
jgi:rhodanese-related sulfurtransferase